MQTIWIDFHQSITISDALALEWYLFNLSSKNTCFILTYYTHTCIVSGRFQNPFQEINFDFLHRNQTIWCRRFSGGGTVYLDPGVRVFSIIGPKEWANSKINLQAVINAFEKKDVHLEQTDKGDLYEGKYKVCGSAFRENKETSLHHFTLLEEANIDFLIESLKVNHILTQAKATASRPAMVKNAQVKLKVSDFKSSFNHYYPITKSLSCHNVYEVIDFMQEDFLVHPRTYSQLQQTLLSKEWKIQQMGEFDATFELSEILLKLKAKKNKIVTVEIERADELQPVFIHELCLQLSKVELSYNDIDRCLNQVSERFNLDESSVEYGLIKEIKKWAIFYIAQLEKNEI